MSVGIHCVCGGRLLGAAAAEWTLGVHDPTLIGWLTVVAYLGTALLCWQCARLERRQPVFWLGAALALLLLGLNKQLDLQSWLNVTARDYAKAVNLYERRRDLERIFVALLIALGGTTFGATTWIFRRTVRKHFLAFAGLLFLLIFILARAAAFHAFDRATGLQSLGSLRLSWVLELAGIGAIATSAIGSLHRHWQRR